MHKTEDIKLAITNNNLVHAVVGLDLNAKIADIFL